ncbi:MAG: Ig-like domain-containing protein, partial [Anaerolineae bacterium]
MHKQDGFYRLVLLVILMALVASACDYTISFGPRGPGSTPVATATAESADLPLPPPRLLARTPEPGEPQDLEGGVALTFDQSMDKASVEAAFTISPTVTGDFRWTEDARTLTFAPTQRLERGRRYHVKVEKTARNIEGEPVLDPITFDFRTVGFLAVSEVQPAPKSDDVDPDTVVTVVFNRPVVPLTSVDRQEELPQPLTFTPEVQGEGEWLNTSIYRFHPEESFQPATTYEVRVVSTLSDTLGGTLEEDHVWTFTTLRPAVARWSPRSNAEHVGPGAVISVTFNQPMDHASAEEAFSLSIGNEPLEGTFTWASDESSDLPEAIRPEIMVFKPAQPLPRTAVVNARVAGSARARSSEVTMSEGTRWQFKTVLEPGIISTSPTDGETDISPYGDVRITFASPMETEDFMSYLRVTPSVTDVYTYWSQANTELHLSFRREPNSTYTLYLDGDAPDRYGAPLGENLRLRFTTGDLPPLASLNREGEIGTFNAYTDTLLFASHRNVSRLDVSLYSLDVDTFMKLHAYGDYEYRRDFYPDEEDLLRQWSVEVDAPRNQASLARLEITDDEGQQLPPGIYYVLLSAPEVLERRGGGEDHFTLIRSRYNLTLKRGTTESLL